MTKYEVYAPKFNTTAICGFKYSFPLLWILFIISYVNTSVLVQELVNSVIHRTRVWQVRHSIWSNAKGSNAQSTQVHWWHDQCPRKIRHIFLLLISSSFPPKKKKIPAELNINLLILKISSSWVFPFNSASNMAFHSIVTNSDFDCSELLMNIRWCSALWSVWFPLERRASSTGARSSSPTSGNSCPCCITTELCLTFCAF